MYVMVRATGDQASLGAGIRAQLQEIDPTVPFEGLHSMNTNLDDRLAPSRFNAMLIGIFATVALVLAVGGIYGTLQYVVGQRQRELGVRLALGADSTDIIRGVVREGMGATIAGVVLGLGLTMLLSRGISALLFGVAPIDLPTFALVSGVLSLTALAACLVPAMRATRVDPVQSLRSD